MLQMITPMNLQQNEVGKNYFSAVRHSGKIAFLDKMCSNIQEMLDYLHNIWNAGDIQELVSHLSSEMRKKYFDSSEKIVDIKLKMDTLLVQQKRLLWSKSVDDRIHGVVALVILDRRMSQWLITIYGIAKRSDENLLLEEYCILDVKRQNPREEIKLDELELVTIKRKSKSENLEEYLLKVGYKKKQDDCFKIYINDELEIKVVNKDKFIICCGHNKELLHKHVRAIGEYLRLEKARVSFKDDMINIEEK